MPKAKGDEAPKAETKAEPAKAAPVQATAESTDSLDRWEDPRAAAALSNMYEFKAALVNPADTLVINQLATGQGATNLGAIDRYVKSWAAELTEKATLDALINLDGNPVKARDLEVAAQSLLKPLNPPLSSANQRFRQQYVAKMTEVFKPILKGNLHSRTMAMIILSRTGDPQVLPTFTAHLSDPEQLAIVKLLSAVGITNAAKNARNSLDGTSAVAAARALSGFLRRARAKANNCR